MRGFFAALQFLTIFSLPRGLAPDKEALQKAPPFFPLIGLLVGFLVSTIDWGLGFIFPVPVRSVLATILLIAFSGALHTDGLADTADGLLSSRPRERMLEIMRDSRTGPMGAVAIVCVVSLKIAAIASLPSPARFWALLLMPVAGRCALLIVMAVLPYARPEGLVGVFRLNRPALFLFWALIFLLATGGLAGGLAGVIAAASSFLFVLLFTIYLRRKLGGYTGDTLGAACELTELIPPLVALAWMGSL
ncbi:MAG: adenosylcobinamide-GDP ribazoletransferase [Syntrophales bacterium]|jgi:adenosylcobinamide-GDP ribazoletransferase|nr:adenosylcobinamide-GDP ribazoletransferase [Syntrophales bacterium]